MAAAGEHYRVVTSPAVDAFIIDQDGVDRLVQSQPALSIPADGTYYVAIEHSAPVSFTLIRE